MIHFDRGVTLRRANEFEASQLFRLVEFETATRFGMRRNPFETRCVSTPHGDGLGETIHFRELSPEKFRYHVLIYQGDWQWPRHLVRAGVLTGLELHPFYEFHFGFSFDVPQVGGGAGRNLKWLIDRLITDDDLFVSLTDQDCTNLKDVELKLRSYNATEPSLNAALDDYLALRQIENHPNMVFLGLFAILEMLITHKPDDNDPYSSITRQMKKKMALLDRRLRLPLSYAEFGKTASAEKIWSALYSVRSAIAHGRRPDFHKARPLRDMIAATRFVRSAVRSVMRQALEEPDLVNDLREC
jgi:Apea-like HEPN